MATLKVDIWSDIACPWCYVGKRRLEAALKDFEHRDHVDVVWRAFELDPSAKPYVAAHDAEPGAYAERLAKKYGTTTARAEEMIARMTETAAADGLDFRFDKIKPGNTFDAHRLIHFAREHGLQDAMKERVLRAYMTEGEPVSDHGVLLRLAKEVGLDGAEAAKVLSTDSQAAEVRADEYEARELGIRGVPFFVLADRFAVSGAQPADLLRGALERAWNELPQREVLSEGAACGPTGCD